MLKRKEYSPVVEEEKRLIEALKELDYLLLPELWQNPLTKSAVESKKAREEGNALYIKDNHDEKMHKEILMYYSKSVAFAPRGSEELALAYGNRSAILAHLGKYREAVDDIDRALSLPLPDIHIAKYLCRKVECQAELGLEEAKDTCDETRFVLQEICATDELKKNVVVKLVKAIVKLEKRKSSAPAIEFKRAFPNSGKFDFQKSSQCPNASSAVVITRIEKFYRHGRHLRATRDIPPGEVLYVGEPYAVCPMLAHVYTNCSHCLRFVWDGLPCDKCVYAIYCSEFCKREALALYHDIECKIIHMCWKLNERMNSARLMSMRLVIMGMREAGGLSSLKQDLEEIDRCKDKIKKGFSNNKTTFYDNYMSAYSLLTHTCRKPYEELVAISRDSAVLLHLLAKYTKIFRHYFDYEQNTLMVNENALFIGKLISHYQHVILINAISVKDIYSSKSTDWTWKPLKEENCAGLYLTPFLSLLNHSCFPNVAKCETPDRKTILYSIRPIAEGEQIFDCYGPTYSELIKQKRHELLIRFYFVCECIACENNWPMFKSVMSNGITYSTIAYPAVEATNKAQQKAEKILKSLKDENTIIDSDTLQDIAYAIILTVKYCESPNWRLPSLKTILTAVFHELYGYIANIPATC